MTNAIELVDVTKSFRAQVAVNKLTLSVPSGSIYGFIGPNGSGKTTTLRMILRIYQPDAGKVIVLGQPQGQVADDRVGYLPEERGLYKRMKVFDLIHYYARLKGVSDAKPKILQWLERMGASEWANKKVDALSKGMAQKVQFISAVIHKPQLLILDEPFSGLDPVNMEVLRDAVMELRKLGTTIVFSTHDMDKAEQMCDYVFMIYRGNKVLDGTLDSIQSAYPADRVRLKFANPEATLPDHPLIQQPQRMARYFEFTVTQPAQAHQVLRDISSVHAVDYFELVRPSLHDIFVQIAGPEAKQAILSEQEETAA
jgi:ABC-2 type transport system ATP-binding protein